MGIISQPRPAQLTLVAFLADGLTQADLDRRPLAFGVHRGIDYAIGTMSNLAAKPPVPATRHFPVQLFSVSLLHNGPYYTKTFSPRRESESAMTANEASSETTPSATAAGFGFQGAAGASFCRGVRTSTR